MANKNNMILLLALFFLITHKSAFGGFDLHKDYHNAQVKLIKKFEKRCQQVEKDADPSILNPLLHDLLFKNELRLLENALQKGADPNYSLKNESLLITAIQLFDCEAITILLKYGADPNKIEQMHTPLLRMHTPLLKASHYPLCILESLLKHKADPNIRSGYLCSPPTALLSIIQKLFPTQYCGYSRPEINRAEHIEAIKLLLYHGANPNIKYRGKSAIDIAQQNDDLGLVKLLSEAQPILINKLHALLSRGETPFPSEIALKIAQFRYEY